MDKVAIHELHSVVQLVFLLMVDCMPNHAEESEQEMLDWYEGLDGEQIYDYVCKWRKNETTNDDCDDVIEPECGTWTI